MVRHASRAASWSASAYEPLFPYFEQAHARGAFRVLADDVVTTEDGTGIVHMAPAYGEDDFPRLPRGRASTLVDPLDAEGRFTAEVPDSSGSSQGRRRPSIRRSRTRASSCTRARSCTATRSRPHRHAAHLPRHRRLVRAGRADPRAAGGAERRHPLGAASSRRSRRFGNWLQGRQRLEHQPQPLLGFLHPGLDQREDRGQSDLRRLDRRARGALSGVRVTDLHKHFVDRGHFQCEEDGKTYRRTPEVLDCWFESGSMPYAQQHYPFENKDRFDGVFPGASSSPKASTRRAAGSTRCSCSARRSSSARRFENVIVNGMILAEDGQKMSKRMKNYPDPDAGAGRLRRRRPARVPDRLAGRARRAAALQRDAA